MLPIMLGIITGTLGAIPLFAFRRVTAGTNFLLIVGFLTSVLYYFTTPSLAYPLFGLVGVMVLVSLAASAIMHCFLEEDPTGALVFPGAGLCIVLVMMLSGGGCFRYQEYASMIGPVEKREWTQDVQPKDPKHVRLVSTELARWLADKQLGEAPGAIGSQFQISDEHSTLQRLKGELWYVKPLDFKDFGVWTSTKTAPGYIRVHGENPRRPVVVKTDESFVFTPGAYFNKNLERHLWMNGYATKGLTDYSLEIDDNDKAWWVVTVYKPTIMWWGERVLGVVIVDPKTGEHAFHELAKVPNWVDRVIPEKFVTNYLTWRGKYAISWWNSMWAEKDVTEPEAPRISYGSDGDPYWVTGITSSNNKDEALVGLTYTNTRTGKTTQYHAVGGTESAALKAVNNKVQFKQWHGTDPVIYNIYGVMSAIVPVLGANHTFQGVAIVRIDTLQVAFGEDVHTASTDFRKLLAGESNLAPELTKDKKTLRGKVDRIADEVKSQGGTVYYIHIVGVPHLFVGSIGSNSVSAKLAVTRVGDEVEITYIASGEEVESLLAFENLSLPLEESTLQRETRERAAADKADDDRARENRSLKGEMQSATEKELLEFKKFREQKKGR